MSKAYPEGTYLFAATPDDDYAIACARAYIAHHKLTGDEVKILRRDEQILVYAKKVVRLKGEGTWEKPLQT